MLCKSKHISTDRLGDYYTKSNKPVREKKIPYDLMKSDEQNRKRHVYVDIAVREEGEGGTG